MRSAMLMHNYTHAKANCDQCLIVFLPKSRALKISQRFSELPPMENASAENVSPNRRPEDLLGL